MKLTPLSRAAAMMRSTSACGVSAEPKRLAPSPTTDTRTPALPICRYSIQFPRAALGFFAGAVAPALPALAELAFDRFVAELTAPRPFDRFQRRERFFENRSG